MEVDKTSLPMIKHYNNILPGIPATASVLDRVLVQSVILDHADAHVWSDVVDFEQSLPHCNKSAHNL